MLVHRDVTCVTNAIITTGLHQPTECLSDTEKPLISLYSNTLKLYPLMWDLWKTTEILKWFSGSACQLYLSFTISILYCHQRHFMEAKASIVCSVRAFFCVSTCQNDSPWQPPVLFLCHVCLWELGFVYSQMMPHDRAVRRGWSRCFSFKCFSYSGQCRC